MASNRALRVETAQESLVMMMAVLDNQPGAARDIVALNAGVALYAANVAATMAEGIARAQAAIASGQAKATMQALVAFSKTFPVAGA
jgi:anthranilate phosphoribosyltransferase